MFNRGLFGDNRITENVPFKKINKEIWNDDGYIELTVKEFYSFAEKINLPVVTKQIQMFDTVIYLATNPNSSMILSLTVRKWFGRDIIDASYLDSKKTPEELQERQKWATESIGLLNKYDLRHNKTGFSIDEEVSSLSEFATHDEVYSVFMPENKLTIVANQQNFPNNTFMRAVDDKNTMQLIYRFTRTCDGKDRKGRLEINYSKISSINLLY